MRSLKIELDGFHVSPTQAIPQSDHINALVLAAGVAESDTVPAKAKIVLFSATSNFYLNTRAAAVIPTVDIKEGANPGTAPEYNPVARKVAPGDTLSIIAPEICIVMLAYYS